MITVPDAVRINIPRAIIPNATICKSKKAGEATNKCHNNENKMNEKNKTQRSRKRIVK